MRRSTITALAAMTMVVLAVAACAGPGSGAGTTELTAADSGSAIEVPNGQSIVIRLDANSTTGYSWQQAPGLDESVVKFVSESYQQATASPGMVGVGGTDTWTYEAVGAGTTTIALAYQRASDPTATQSFTVNVTVAQ
ncbi:MAG TPA: protease inhibitor I42 family protein [Candidatus Limnocylindrales bacterium]|jgi:inhibitor of cysteine peptidase